MKAKKPANRGGSKRRARAKAARRATAAKAGGPARGNAKARKASGRSRNAARRASVSDEVVLEAAVLRRLLKHFDERKDVQNIELMILAGFCRNCLSKWLVEAAAERGLEVDIERAREKVYGMPYEEWKSRFQQPATEEQLQRFAASSARTKGEDQ
jgi:hypothetical protein